MTSRLTQKSGFAWSNFDFFFFTGFLLFVLLSGFLLFVFAAVLLVRFGLGFAFGGGGAAFFGTCLLMRFAGIRFCRFGGRGGKRLVLFFGICLGGGREVFFRFAGGALLREELVRLRGGRGGKSFASSFTSGEWDFS